jgi:hypothetical protein
MMSLTCKGLLLITACAFSGCTVKGYNGAELPEDAVATVGLKAPTISFIPLFWVFPFNTLAWLADDWHETAWMDTIEVNNIQLNRFKTVLAQPGLIWVHAKETHILNKTQVGSSECTNGACSCTEKEGKDKKKEKVCEQTVSCTENYRVTAKNDVCRLTYSVEAKKHYEVFIRERTLMLQDENEKILETKACKFSPSYTYETTETSSSTQSCYY